MKTQLKMHWLYSIFSLSTSLYPLKIRLRNLDPFSSPKDEVATLIGQEGNRESKIFSEGFSSANHNEGFTWVLFRPAFRKNPGRTVFRRVWFIQELKITQKNKGLWLMPNLKANEIRIEYDSVGDSSSPPLLLIIGFAGQMIFLGWGTMRATCRNGPLCDPIRQSRCRAFV